MEACSKDSSTTTTAAPTGTPRKDASSPDAGRIRSVLSRSRTSAGVSDRRSVVARGRIEELHGESARPALDPVGHSLRTARHSRRSNRAGTEPRPRPRHERATVLVLDPAAAVYRTFRVDRGTGCAGCADGVPADTDAASRRAGPGGERSAEDPRVQAVGC